MHTLVTNIQGTENVLDHCNRFGKRVLSPRPRRSTATGASPRRSTRTSRRMYGPTTARRWAYAESKALDEFLALAYHQERGLDCVIVRLFNTVGPRQSGQYGMVIPRFVSARARGPTARDPRRRHADALLLPRPGHDPRAAGLMDAATTSGEIFNVGSTERVTIVELAQRVLAADGFDVGDRLRPVRRGLRPGDRGHAPPPARRSRRSRRAIGWQPTRIARRDPRRRDRARPHRAGARRVAARESQSSGAAPGRGSTSRIDSRAGEEHREPVDAEADAAGRRHAVRERLDVVGVALLGLDVARLRAPTAGARTAPPAPRRR